MACNNFPQRLLLQAYVTKKEDNFQKTNSPLCCAERRLLSELYRQAKVKGISNHKTSTWIHRKYKNITIIRETSYGLGTSFPCIFCRSSLEKLDMRVTCMVDNKMQCIRISDCKHESKQTTGQMLNTQPLKPCTVQANRDTRRAKQTQNFPNSKK